MSEDSNRNATASWSGFSHQGQVGLLIALRELQKEGVDKDNNYVLYEKHEDVAVYFDNSGVPEFLSVHQVKAYYSDGSDKKSKYNSVLNHDFEAGNERFLHTVLEINDWDTSTTSNNNNVSRYEYSNGTFHCGTTQIEIFIKEELKKLIGNNDGKIENVLKKLTYQLDLKIRSEHQKKTKNLFDVKFSLSEIENFVNDESEFILKEIYDCRKLFHDLYIDAKKKSILTDSQLIIVDKLIDEIYHTFSDEEFLLFIRRLSLNRNSSHQNTTQSIFNEDGLKQVFFKLLMNISNIHPEIKKNELTVSYSNLRYVLTTIIDEQDDAKEVVQNILMNLDSHKILWERTSLINKEINGNFHELNPEFFDVRKYDQKVEDFKGFMQHNGSTSFICRVTATKNLTNGATD